MNVSEIMEQRVATVHPTDGIHVAATRMRDRDCGCVVVVDDEERAVGVLTDRDVCMAALRTDLPLSGLVVSDAMTAHPFYCYVDDTIDAVEDAMARHQVRRLPVVDDEGRLRGLVALDDVAREAARDADLFAPPVSCAGVGRTLGQIVRPRLIGQD